jgi:hypothetical protein
LVAVQRIGGSGDRPGGVEGVEDGGEGRRRRQRRRVGGFLLVGSICRHFQFNLVQELNCLALRW